MYIDDDYLRFQSHIARIRKQFSNDSNSTQYNYIYTGNDLQDALIRGMSDLGYPLRKEVKRDRFVLNSEGFRRAMEIATKEALNQMEREIYQWIQSDVKNMIEDTTQDVLNSINVMNNNLVVTSKGKKPKKTFAEKLGEKFGVALAKSILTIFDEIVKGSDKYK